MSQKSLREQAVAEIKKHMAKHGSGRWELIRPRFESVAESTWWRWVGVAKNQSTQDSAVAAARSATVKGKRPPPVPLPQRETVESRQVPKIEPREPAMPDSQSASLPVVPEATLKNLRKARNIDVLDEILRVLQGADKLERFACHEDGAIKMPKVFQNSLLIRLRASSVYVEAFRAVWDIKRIQLLHNLIIDAVGRASPELAQEIIARLSSADALYAAAGGNDPISGNADAADPA